MKNTLILVLALLWVSLVGVAILSEKLKPITKIVEVLKEVAVDMKDMKVTVLSDDQYEMLLSIHAINTLAQPMTITRCGGIRLA